MGAAIPQYVGGLGDDFLYGGSGADELYGLGGNDTLEGLGGNDHLDGGDGADLLSGGTGDDRYVVGSMGDQIIEQFGEGSDTVYSSIAFSLGENVENLSLTGTSSINALGNGLNNWISGNPSANILDGREGADTMAGGDGDDLYVVDNIGDIVGEFPGEGTDSVHSSVSFGLGVEIENLVLTGSAAIDGSGNDLPNHIQGNSGANLLSGRGGGDTLTGGAGSDIFFDTVSGHNSDLITDFQRGDRIVFSDATLDAFNYSLSGQLLTFSGGSLTLSGLQNPSIAASRAPEGGVQITFSGPRIIVDTHTIVPATDFGTSAAPRTGEAEKIVPAQRDLLGMFDGVPPNFGADTFISGYARTDDFFPLF